MADGTDACVQTFLVFTSDLQYINRPPSLDQLRAERLRREAAERARAEALLARVQGRALQEAQPEEETDDRRRRYNSQFNPQLARRPRQQDPHFAH
nr:leukocyte receptor cluster member 1 [Macaca nemestrina]